jgi:WD40 repeat protein
MVQDNQYEYEKKEENKLKLVIKPYTKSEKAFEFILEEKQDIKDLQKRCEICDRVHSGINYLRFMRDNKHNNIISSNNNISYNINCNYNNINNNDEYQDKGKISKILEEIDLLKKENLLKNEQIKKLNQEIFELKHLKIIPEDLTIKNDLSDSYKNIIKANPLLDMGMINFENNYHSINDNPTKIHPKKIFLKSQKPTNILFDSNPNNLKYKYTIVKDLSAKGVNDIFEVFISNIDNKAYLVSKNAKSHLLDIILLKDNIIITSLKGHTNTITMVRKFFNNNNKNEYLISADIDNNVIVWDINNNYNILHLIKPEYNENNIYSCYIYFDIFNSYIFTSCGLNKYKESETSYTKMYSFKNGSFIKNINETSMNNTYYLLMWYNEQNKNRNNYLVECCENRISINDFKNNKLYANLVTEKFKVLKYYSGFIYNFYGKDYLICSASNGVIVIWDLLLKSNIFYGKISKVELYNIIQWNNNYAIISGGRNQNIKIFDLNTFKIVNNIQIEKSSNVNCVKKIVHPLYGESLLCSGNNHKIKLFSV